MSIIDHQLIVRLIALSTLLLTSTNLRAAPLCDPFAQGSDSSVSLHSVTLKKAIELNCPFSVPSNFTLSGNGHSITLGPHGRFLIEHGSEVVIRDTKFVVQASSFDDFVPQDGVSFFVV